MNQLLDSIYKLFGVLVTCPTVPYTCPSSAPWEAIMLANTGGPRSRIVSTPVVSRLLSEGSKTLGLRPLGDYEIQPRSEEGKFRKLAQRLLQEAGFSSPEEAWKSFREELPDQPALVVDLPHKPSQDRSSDHKYKSLIATLVLGKCCGSLFSPERPIIWSERRLSRSLRLVHCDSATFTLDDDE